MTWHCREYERERERVEAKRELKVKERRKEKERKRERESELCTSHRIASHISETAHTSKWNAARNTAAYEYTRVNRIYDAWITALIALLHYTYFYIFRRTVSWRKIYFPTSSEWVSFAAFAVPRREGSIRREEKDINFLEVLLNGPNYSCVCSYRYEKLCCSWISWPAYTQYNTLNESSLRTTCVLLLGSLYKTSVLNKYRLDGLTKLSENVLRISAEMRRIRGNRVRNLQRPLSQTQIPSGTQTTTADAPETIQSLRQNSI